MARERGVGTVGFLGRGGSGALGSHQRNPGDSSGAGTSDCRAG
jgi:hypothetical protein